MKLRLVLLMMLSLQVFDMFCNVQVLTNVRLLEPLLHRISEEQGTVLFAIFAFTHQQVAKALIDKQQQGVIVQGVVDKLSTEKIGWQGNLLKRNDIDVKVYNSNYRSCMHHKFVVFGDNEVWTGSANWTKSALNGTNHENIVIIKDNPDIVKSLKRSFYEMYRAF